MARYSRGLWVHLLKRLVVTALTGMTSIQALTAQAETGTTARPRIDPWPCRIVAPQTLREAFEQGWARSKVIRSQCEELAGARAVVALKWVAADSLSHARTVMAMRGGVVAATVGIPAVGETIVLLAHELQHVVEMTRGLDVEAESKRQGSGVWKTAGGYETQAAIEVTRQVSSELREARKRGRENKER